MPAEVASQEVYHRETQLGPFSESEKEIALQMNSLARSERDFADFCRRLQEEDCNDQIQPEDEARKEDGPSSRAGSRGVGTHDEEDVALEGDIPGELAAMYRKFWDVNPDEDRDKKEAVVRTSSIRVWERARESNVVPKRAGVGLPTTSAWKDRPTMETH